MFFSDEKDAIYANKGKYTVAGNLKKKTIKWLEFSTCNSVNLDVYSLADAFMNKMIITQRMVAWDGGVIFNYKTRQAEPGAYDGWIKEIKRQHTWYKYVDKSVSGKPKRKRVGRVEIIFNMADRKGHYA